MLMLHLNLNTKSIQRIYSLFLTPKLTVIFRGRHHMQLGRRCAHGQQQLQRAVAAGVAAALQSDSAYYQTASASVRCPCALRGDAAPEI